MNRSVAVLVACILGFSGDAAAQSRADSAAARAAAIDYLEGFYQGDSTRFLRSIRPEVYKFGFSRQRSTGRYTGMQMSWSSFLESAREVRAGRESVPAGAPRDVRILDLLDQTAVVKVTALWGVDFLLMAKYDGRWMISHVLWQSMPPK